MFQVNFDPDPRSTFSVPNATPLILQTNKQTKWRTYTAFWWLIFWRVVEYLQLLHLPQVVGLSLAAREVERDVKKGEYFFLLWRFKKYNSNIHFAIPNLGLKINVRICQMCNNKIEVELDPCPLTHLDRWLWSSYSVTIYCLLFCVTLVT